MPSPCQAIENQITTIEGEIQAITDELNNIGSDTPPGAAAALVKQLIALNRRLSSLKKELQVCLDPCSPIEANIQADESEIVGLTAQISTTNTQIQSLTTQLAGLNAQLPLLNAKLTSVQSDLQQQQQALAQCQAAH